MLSAAPATNRSSLTGSSRVPQNTFFYCYLLFKYSVIVANTVNAPEPQCDDTQDGLARGGAPVNDCKKRNGARLTHGRNRYKTALRIYVTDADYETLSVFRKSVASIIGESVPWSAVLMSDSCCLGLKTGARDDREPGTDLSSRLKN